MTVHRIYLTGFMAAGKTTVGRALARKLDWKFIDLDKDIEKSEGRTIATIFKDSGEAYFRELERSRLHHHSGTDRLVVALGGGAFAHSPTREIANSSGVTVWLKTPFKVIASRVRPDGVRPLFQNRAEARRLFVLRQDSYKMAKLHVSAAARRPSEIAEEIMQKLDQL